MLGIRRTYSRLKPPASSRGCKAVLSVLFLQNVMFENFNFDEKLIIKLVQIGLSNVWLINNYKSDEFTCVW